MKCPRCQHENEVGAKFCEECAVPLARTCRNCGHQLSRSAKFCPECALPTGPSEGSTALRFSSRESYTPQHLAERILNSKAALEGERKQVTVLFADLKGSMELLADRDPEDARQILDPVLERMMEAVHRYEGTVNQVMGDGIMALFGAPLAHEDHAVRACYAALRMQETVKQYAEEVRREQGITIGIRVGLNSGEVVVRSIGSDLHMDYSAIGQTTHLAARMEQLADPGSALLTSATLALTAGFVQATSLGLRAVKGLPTPVEVHVLVGAGHARSRVQAAATRGLTRFVGRTAETDQVHRALEQAAAGRGQVVAVVGEPGVGKSRLFHEVIHSDRTSGWLVLETTAIAYGKGTPYLPVVDVLRRYFELHSGDDHPTIRDNVTRKIGGLNEALLSAQAAVLALLDVPVDEPGWRALEASQRRLQTLDAVKRLILARTRVQPVLLVFENLHWIDGETQALLDGLVDSLPGSRLLLLVNYRPEYAHGWTGKTYYSQLRLDPLASDSAYELFRALLGNDPSLDSLEPLLLQRTAGNPFFIEECVQTLVETGQLIGDRGSYRLAHPLEAIQVPATVQAVLAARIDRLAPDDKRLLQAAAVVGANVPLTLLREVADLEEAELHRALTNLQRTEFLYETALFPEAEYTFKHALTHEVAYRAVLHERRRALHTRLADGIEHLYPDRLDEHSDQLAHHAVNGERWEKAVTWLRRAGARAASRSASHEAVERFEQALGALGHLPNTRAREEIGIDIRLDIQSALNPLGRFDEMVRHLRAAETMAEALGDKPRLARVSGYLTHAHWWRGELDRAIAAGERTFAIAAGLGGRDAEAMAHYRLALSYGSTGQFDLALDHCRRNVDALRGDLVYERCGLPVLPAVQSRAFIALILAWRGEFDEAATIGSEALQLAEAAAHAYTLTNTLGAVGGALRNQGLFARATIYLERALALAEANHFVGLLPFVTQHLGHTYAQAGRPREALRLLERGMTQARRMGQVPVQLQHLVAFSEAHLHVGELREAITTGAETLTRSRTLGIRFGEAQALVALGNVEAVAASPPFDPAKAHYAEALALTRALGMQPLVAHCHLGLGTLYRRTEKQEQAQEHLATATTMYRAMAMHSWLEKAEAEMTVQGR